MALVHKGASEVDVCLCSCAGEVFENGKRLHFLAYKSNLTICYVCVMV